MAGAQKRGRSPGTYDGGSQSESSQSPDHRSESSSQGYSRNASYVSSFLTTRLRNKMYEAEVSMPPITSEISTSASATSIFVASSASSISSLEAQSGNSSQVESKNTKHRSLLSTEDPPEMQLRAHGAPTDLHAALSPLFLEEVASELKNFTQVIKRTTDARWVLFQHADGWYLEVQCKTTRDLLANKGERDKFVRGANVAIPGSRSVPDIMVSFLPHHGCSRIPLWFIDLKLEVIPIDAWSQAFQYGLDGLRHNARVCPDREGVIRTSIWDYGSCKQLELATWELHKVPFSVTSAAIKNQSADPFKLANSVVEWCSGRAAELHALERQEVKAGDRWVMWFSESELNACPDLVSRFGTCTFVPRHSLRHSIYITATGWFLKLLRKDSLLPLSETLEKHHAMIDFVRSHLNALSEGMVPEHQYLQLSRQ